MARISARFPRIFFSFFFLACCAGSFSSVIAEPGATGLTFLTLGVGARAASMGNAQVAVATDATALFWNPAGLAEVRGNEVTVSHSEWIEGIRYEFAGLAAAYGKSTVAVGFQWLYLSERNEGRDRDGNLDGDWGYYDLAYSVSLARKFQGGLELGVSYKRLTEMIDNNYARGEALDAGLRLPTPIRGVTLAGSVQNIGRNMTFKSEDFELPRTVTGGIGVERKAPGGTLVLGCDLRAPRGEDNKVHAGAEFTLSNGLSIAAGYKTGYDNENVSFGVGFATSALRVNYSFTPFYSDLGNVQRVSLSRAF